MIIISFFKKCSGIKNIKSKILLVFNFTIDYRGNKQKILMITDPWQFGKKISHLDTATIQMP